jgi:VWFA-related protein
MDTESHRSWFARGAAASVCLVAVAALFAAQVPPPGQDPTGPPPQPGQLGSASNSEKTGSGANGAEAAKPGESTATVPGESSDYTFRAGTRYVLVPTTVLDPDGHGYVNGLKVKDFTVYDNGKEQKITSEMTEQPVSLVLAVQANSEVEPLLPEIRKSGLLLQGLVTGQEGDAAILAFDHRMQVLQDFTNDPAKLDDAMHRLTSGSSTAAVVDAVREADEMLIHHDRQNSQRRRVIVLMSRNIDKGSQAKLDETVRKMQFDNVIVYCIDISRVKTALLKKPDYPRPPNGGQPASAQPNITGQTWSDTNVVQQMDGNALNGVPPIYRGIRDLFKRSPAEAFTYFTGGQLYSFSNQRGLEDAMTDIGKNLNSQYMLTYNLNNKEEPGFHNIRVEVDRPGLKVRTRVGYWWGGGQQ